MPEVSIIIPAFNAKRYLRETLESVLAQTHPSFEVIAVDDGSTDATPEVLGEYAGRIRVLRQANAGRAAACNAGARMAEAEWLAFIDADDLWSPEKLEIQLRNCAQFAISHTNSYFFGENCQEVTKTDITPQYGGWVLDRLLVGNFITTSTVMLRRDVYFEFGGFDRGYYFAEDWPLWLRVCAKYELGYVAQPLGRYRVHAASKTMRVPQMHADALRILEEAFAEGGVARDLGRLRRTAFGMAYLTSSHYAATVGDWRFAASCAARSLLYRPLVVRAWKNLIKAGVMPLGVKY